MLDNSEFEIDDVVRGVSINLLQTSPGFLLFASKDQYSRRLREEMHEAELHNRRNDAQSDCTESAQAQNQGPKVCSQRTRHPI